MKSLYRIVLAIVLVVGTASGADQDFSQGILDRAAALASAAEVDRDRYPDADEVLVAGIQRIRYREDGTYVQWHEEYVKVLTEKGRRRNSTIASYFTIPYQRGPEDCKVTLAEIIKPDGSIKPIDVEGQSRVMVDPSSMSANIYNPNNKILRVNVAGLEIGDVLHCVLYDAIVQPRMRETWCDWFVLESTRPLISSAVEVSAPKSRPLQCVALKDEIAGTVTSNMTENAESWLYRWEARDVPRMFPEPNMPPVHTVVQRLLVSTAPDWAYVSRWYWDLSLPHYETTPKMDEKVQALTAGLDDPEKKVKALFLFVSQEIRYMGITVETTSPGYEPHDVKDTFDARHGVCRDKAALLVVLLRQAGLDAFPALIHNGTKKDREVPQPYFNHAIVALRDGPGAYTLMDPTDENTSELLPAYLNDKSFLVATPDGDTLRTSPIDPVENNLMKIETRARLETDGDLRARTTLRFDGINDNAYRQWFARIKPDDRRRFFEGLVKKAAAGAMVTDLQITPRDMTDVSSSLCARVTCEASESLVSTRDSVWLPVPSMGTQVGMVNFLLGRTGLKERRYPLVTDIACGTRERVTVALPPYLAKADVVLPPTEEIDNETLLWRRTMVRTNANLLMEFDFRLKVPEFTPAQYLELKEALKRSERAAKKGPIFAIPPERPYDPRLAAGADRILLNDLAEYDLRDARNWTEERTVRSRVLTYAGKKDNAEIEIHYNAAWEDVRIDSAIVTGPDGVSHKIEPKEINVMDAPWVGSAPRYPPEQTLVAGFPAVEIGSVIEYRYIRVCRDHPPFALRTSFRGMDSILEKTVGIVTPSKMPIQVNVNGYDDIVVDSTTGEDTPDKRLARRWTARNVRPVADEDRLPPWWVFNPTLFASTGQWPDYAAEVERALTQAADKQTEAEATARRLLRNRRDPWERLECLRDFMATRVRSAGPLLHELPLSALTPADRTLADGYGNNADRAILLYAMLKATGYRPEFVLASGHPFIEPMLSLLRDHVAPAEFPIVLVRLAHRKLRLPEGTYVYMDGSDQYAAVGTTPYEGCIALTLPRGNLEAVRPAKPDMSAISFDVDLADNGDATLIKKRMLSGDAYAQGNRRFAEMTPEERRRYHLEAVAEISQGARAVGELHADFSVYPGIVEFTMDVDEFAARDGDYIYFSLPTSLAGLFRMRADERTNPLYLDRPQRVTIHTAIHVPAGFEPVHVPPAIRSTKLGCNISVSVSVSSPDASQRTHILIAGEATITPTLVNATDYPELQGLDQDLSHPRSTMVLLKMSPQTAAVP